MSWPSVPIPRPPATRQAVAAVQQGNPPARRSLRPALSIAVAIAALLAGSATVGSRNATPDSALWGITKVVWPDRAQSVASRDNARHALDQAESAIKAGLAQEAQLALLRATVELGNVDEVDGRDGMQQRVADLWRQAAPPELAGTLPSTDTASSSAVATTRLTTNAPTSAAAAESSPVTPAAEPAPLSASVEPAPAAPAPGQLPVNQLADRASGPSADPGTDTVPSSGVDLNSGRSRGRGSASGGADGAVAGHLGTCRTRHSVRAVGAANAGSSGGVDAGHAEHDPSTPASTQQAPAPTPPTADTNGPTSEVIVPAEKSSSAKQQGSPTLQSDKSTTTVDTAVAG